MRRGGRGRGASRNQDDEHEPKFEPKTPEQSSGFDDLNETKLGKKQEKMAQFAGRAGYFMDEQEVCNAAVSRSRLHCCSCAATLPYSTDSSPYRCPCV